MISFRNLRRSLFSVCASLLLCPLSAVQAQDQSPVSISLEARVVKQGEDGKERFVSGEKAAPGEIVEYVATCKNVSGQTIKNLKPVIPIPAGMDVLPGSPVPAQAEAKTAKDEFKPIPLQRKIKQQDGSTKLEPVPPSEYRGVRWTLPELKAGATAAVSVRVQVQSNTATSAPSPTASK